MAGRRFGNLVLMSASILFILMFCDLLLSVLLPVRDPYEEFKNGKRRDDRYIYSQFAPHFSMIIESEEDLPGMSGHKGVFSTNNEGFRGDALHSPKAKNEMRVFILGGSTAECMYLDDSLALNAVLQRHLQSQYSGKSIKVFGAGKSGDASPDHIAMLAQRIVHLEPDAVILFMGINDMRRSMCGYDFSHSFTYRTEVVPSPIKLLMSNSQLYRRLYYALLRFSIGTTTDGQEVITKRTAYGWHHNNAIRQPVAGDRPRGNLRAYQANLTTIHGICQAQGIQLFLMTQSTTWNSRVDSEIRNWHWFTYTCGKRYDEAAMDSLMEEYNQIMRQYASKNDIPLYDLSRKLPKSGEYMYDDCHFNLRGAEYAGKELADFITHYQMKQR